jgi:hypothetical protein
VPHILTSFCGDNTENPLLGIFKNAVQGLSAVAHFCNPSYLGGRDYEEGRVRPAYGKSLSYPISTNKQGGVAHACHA